MRQQLLQALVVFLFTLNGNAQQIPDSAFNYRPHTPAYASGMGPVVMLDEAHHNFHRIDGRYMAFARTLANDGYVMKPGTEPFTAAHLKQARILVIANALGDDGPWVLPTAHAFSNEEVAAVGSWVREGGNLFLIADHMPFGGAARRLGRVFGFNWINGYAMRDDGGPERFSRSLGNLATNAITNGRSAEERIDSIMAFTGSAFIAPPEAMPITTLGSDYSILLPEQAGTFSDTTAWIEGRYFTNGAMLEHGEGRVVCFGEAAMFSAQRQGPRLQPMGMNQPGAEQNPQLLLNIIHWLDMRP
jgi:hypothetical protein